MCKPGSTAFPDGHPQPETQPPYEPSLSDLNTEFTPTSTRTSISLSDRNGNQLSEYLPHMTITPSQNVSTFKTTFACIKLQLNDILILHSFPEPINTLIQGVVITHWPKGIQKAKPLELHETDASGISLKLKGNPWLSQPQFSATPGETIMSIRLLVQILDALQRAGWVLTFSAGTAAGLPHHKPTLLFRHQDPAPAPLQWVAVSVLHVGVMDTLRVLDGPEALCRDLASELERAEMTRRYGRTFDGVYDYELGRHRCTTDNVDVQHMMLLTLGVLDKHGFTVATSINQSSDHGKPDTWYASRPLSWRVGMPVFHR